VRSAWQATQRARVGGALPCRSWHEVQVECCATACISCVGIALWHETQVGGVSPGRWWQLAQFRWVLEVVGAATAAASARWQSAQRVHHATPPPAGRSRWGA